jgi:hypothetical protein
MFKDSKTLLTEAIEDTINDLDRTRDETLMGYSDEEFQGPIRLDDQKKKMSCPGLYCFVHEPTGKVGYWGISRNLSSRVGVHVRVFENNGEPLPYNTDSPPARQMYEYDSDKNNWQIWIQRTSTIEVAAKLEQIWGTRTESMFNDTKMLGKL